MMKIFALFIVAVIMTACIGHQKELAYQDVVNRMIDLKRLAELPVEGEKSGMFSSYDRKSAYDTLTAKYINWSANDDGLTPQFIRNEGENMVLAEMKGPGAIVRIWSASPGKGHVKIFIDGADTATIDLSFRDYFNTASILAFNFPGLVYETNARGFNNYVPITFQKSIKIVGEPGWGQYYHFNYITFPEDQIIGKFETTPSNESVAALQYVNQKLTKELSIPIGVGKKDVKTISTVTIAPGELQTIAAIKEKRAINQFKVKISNIDSSRIKEVLRKTILTMKWDGEEEASVWSPMGDFFGTAPGVNSYKTLPMGMTDGWMYSYWYMPFQQSGEIFFENNLDIPIEFSVELVHERLSGNPDNYGRFHAKWHRDIMPVDSTRWPDWTVLKTSGKGRFVGMFLSVWNPKGGSCREFGGAGQHWWGEGDEKFFVDGEKFPSTFGTGTEDYFGYAWCLPNYFEHAFHSQNYTEGNMGYQSLNRWQIIDNVPFQTNFEAYLEKYFPNEWPTQYAAVAYWYLNENGNDPIQPTPVNDLFGYETQYAVYRAENAIEGENLEIVSNSGGWVSADVFSQEQLFNQVSGHKMLAWVAKKDSENKLETSFNMAEGGKYKIYANIHCSKNGGMFDIILNGKELKKKLSFRHDNPLPSTKYVLLGTVDVPDGKQNLTVKWVESDSSGKRMELDYLKFEKIN